MSIWVCCLSMERQPYSLTEKLSAFYTWVITRNRAWFFGPWASCVCYNSDQQCWIDWSRRVQSSSDSCPGYDLLHPRVAYESPDFRTKPKSVSSARFADCEGPVHTGRRAPRRRQNAIITKPKVHSLPVHTGCGPVHTGGEAPCRRHHANMGHIVANRSVHTTCI